MAAGDVTVFNAAKVYMLDGAWPTTDVIKCAVLDNTSNPTAGAATPQLGSYTEVGTGGTYVSGGTSLGTWGAGVQSTTGGAKFDSATNPNWAADTGNDSDAYWGLLYNDTQTGDPAIAFVELGGPIDMKTGALTITWHADGIFTLT
jgi:hypothetical protein